MIFTPTSGMKDQVVDLNPLDMKAHRCNITLDPATGAISFDLGLEIIIWRF
jgi:hypothetical protein